MNIRPSPKEQEKRRIRAIEAIQQGFTQSHVAAMLGITSASVSNWALRFRSGGMQELLAKPRGRPPGGQLSAKQAAEVQRILLTRCPDEVGLQARLWTWRSVQALIFRRCNTEISRWTALRYLNNWGFRPPISMSRLGAAVKRDLANRCEAIRSSARESGGVFYFIERTAFAASGGPVSADSATSILWALGARAEAAFMVVSDQTLAQGMSRFLDRLVDHSHGRTCVIVVDREIRRDSALRDWVGGKNSKIVVKTLDVPG